MYKLFMDCDVTFGNPVCGCESVDGITKEEAVAGGATCDSDGNKNTRINRVQRWLWTC